MWHFDPTMHLTGKSICNKISSTRESGRCSFHLCLSLLPPPHLCPTPPQERGRRELARYGDQLCIVFTQQQRWVSPFRAQCDPLRISRRLLTQCSSLCNPNSKRVEFKKLYFIISIYEYWYSWGIFFFFKLSFLGIILGSQLAYLMSLHIIAGGVGQLTHAEI